MNENLLQYWEKVKQYWNRYSRTTKITFIATVFLLVLTAAIISFNLSKTEYSLAFTDLQPSDAASIKNYLDTAKIPYHLSGDGKSIEVPTSEVANVKLAVESQGLNKNGSLGFGAFSGNSSFGITDNEFKVKYLNAVQGELQQLINSNQGISSSKVLITLPEDGPFLKQQQEQATASVVLQLKPGYTMDQPKIDTIYNLVSHSVKNLPLENITISDQYGESLNSSKTGGQTAANLVTSQAEINNQFRNDLQKNISSMLGTMLGRDKVIVSVFSTMNFDQKKSKEQLVSAPNQVDQRGLEISLQEATESYQNDGATNGGVPGTGTTDVPGYPGSSGSGQSNSEKNSKTVNYEVNRITNDIISTPYVVKDLSINVGIEPPLKDDPNSLTAETKAAVQAALVNIVRTALADNKVTYTDAELQQKVTVFAHSFVRPADAAATKTATYLTYGGLALAALVLGVIGGLILRKRKKAAQQLEEELNMPAAKAELPTIDIENVTNDNQVRKQLETLAKKRPEDFVNLLRTWLVDE
ncbi:flagellar basal-body MS-ring/collar protein FliF [Paenibacillus sedimenti]|uniref:Flagellar M-ring protein n=1 Tax=Paenibacillus sedimenti TaxID=2770274 RepID=A0A926KQS7_9BACL|nr:flagellar basal-body MS-ring/collar protein FliF [Paenibacillus sedimenti]MBD0380360.1 flagellar M-ring protein FliF [Paenibacillus sedimenti]